MILDRLENLSAALRFYKKLGYQEIEVPWIVGPKAMAATIPADRRAMDVLEHGSLVASGEQSFIQMWLDEKLPDGKYCCCTPCFRDEPVVTDLSRLYFMKVELIEVGTFYYWHVEDMLCEALEFHREHIPDVRFENTEFGHDLFSGDVELGSYGSRQRQFMSHGGRVMKWVYGTGCAEPRFSYCKNRHKQSLQREWEIE